MLPVELEAFLFFFQNVYNTGAYGAKTDGVTDDSGALQAAINAASAAGGGVVTFASGVTAIANTVTLASNVWLAPTSTTTIRWVGVAGGTMFTTSSVNVTVNTAVAGNGAFIDPGVGAGTIVFNLHSPQFSLFSGFQLVPGSTTTTLFRIRADCTNANGLEGSRNAGGNTFANIHCPGTIGTVFDLAGQAAPAGVVTLNRFKNIQASGVSVIAVNNGIYTDSNFFDGIQRYSLTANNAVGLNVAADPTAYGVFFTHLAVDTFTGALTGRIGIQLGAGCSRIQINRYENNPTAEGGTLVDHGASLYWISGDDGTNVLKTWTATVQFFPVDGVIKVESAVAATIAELRAENTAAGGVGRLLVFGKTAGSAQVVGEVAADSGGSIQIGSTTMHPILFLYGTTEAWRISSASLTLFTEGHNLQFGTGTGTMLGTSATQKIGHYGVTPVVQPTATGNTHTVTAGSTTNVFTNTTFDGGTGASAYTVGDIVKALKALGLLAA